MKSYILLVTLLMIIFCHWSSASSTGLEQRKTMVAIIGKRLRDLWTWIWNKGQGQGHFVARCFGVARQLKFAMPLIIFKLGVIVTILVFLTIFSLKSLALLVLLVLLKSSGLAAKFAHSKTSKNEWAPPQNVHYHVNPKDYYKSGHYVSHSDDDQGWYDKNEVDDHDYESLEDRLKKLNIYENYYKKYGSL